jgi:RsmE family RNA methyltransferase
MVMYIGPEGGWSDEDMKMLNQHQVQWQSIGDRILRTETATIIGAYTLLNL